MKNGAGAEGGGTVRLQLNADDIAAAMDETKSLHLPGAEPAGSSARVLRDAVVYCGKKSSTCDLVFMLNSGIAVEGASELIRHLASCRPGSFLRLGYDL